jgi:hypothetical protein
MSTRKEVRELRLAEWEKIFKDRAETGLNITRYCELHNLSRDSYYYWQNIARVKALSQMKTPALVELKPPPIDFEKETAPVSNTQSTDVFITEATVSVNNTSISVNSNTPRELLAMVLEVVSNVQ